MSRIRITFGVLCLCALLSVGVTARQPRPASGLTVIVDDKGAVSLELRVVPPTPPPQPDGRPEARAHGFFLVALPLAVNLGEKNLNFANMRLAPVRVGKGYTLLSLIIPVNKGEVKFRLNDVGAVKETREGRGFLELDYSYTDMPPDERELLGLPTAISEFDLEVVLPEKYDERDVTLSPPSPWDVRDNLYALDYAKLRQERDKRVSVSFPNPVKRVAENVKFVLTFLLSVLLVLGELKLFKEKETKWPLAVFLISAAMLLITFRYAYALRAVAEFKTFAAGFVPQVLYGLAASAYQMLASKYRAEVSGYVSIDGDPGGRVEVSLVRVANGQPQPEAYKTTTDKDGNYEFHLWLWKQAVRAYQVEIFESFIHGSGRSEVFEVRGKGRHQRSPIQLKSRNLSDQPGTTAGAAADAGITGPAPASTPS